MARTGSITFCRFRAAAAAGCWLLAAFSVLSGEGQLDEFAGLMAELFDAIMSTFRWTVTGASRTMAKRS